MDELEIYRINSQDKPKINRIKEVKTYKWICQGVDRSQIGIKWEKWMKKKEDQHKEKLRQLHEIKRKKLIVEQEKQERLEKEKREKEMQRKMEEDRDRAMSGGEQAGIYLYEYDNSIQSPKYILLTKRGHIIGIAKDTLINSLTKTNVGHEVIKELKLRLPKEECETNKLHIQKLHMEISSCRSEYASLSEKYELRLKEEARKHDLEVMTLKAEFDIEKETLRNVYTGRIEEAELRSKKARKRCKQLIVQKDKIIHELRHIKSPTPNWLTVAESDELYREHYKKKYDRCKKLISIYSGKLFTKETPSTFFKNKMIKCTQILKEVQDLRVIMKFKEIFKSIEDVIYYGDSMIRAVCLQSKWLQHNYENEVVLEQKKAPSEANYKEIIRHYHQLLIKLTSNKVDCLYEVN